MNPSDLLLIALLPQPVDLERAKAGWYRVPVAHAPATLVRAKALAFYQPASFGAEQRCQVAWWGKVLSVETARRRDLIPEESDHRRAEEWYICVRLVPLIAVEPVKRAEKGRRLLFVPTSWGAFQQATTLDELVASPPHPISDDPLYGLIQQQITDQGGIPDPHMPHQRRLFELSDAEYDALDW
ncbi:MAG: hypothetical protein ACRDIB_03875 [Ardenticatenaceae bacterium]